MTRIFAPSASGWELETRKGNLLLEMKNGRPVVSYDSPLLTPSFIPILNVSRILSRLRFQKIIDLFDVLVI